MYALTELDALRAMLLLVEDAFDRDVTDTSVLLREMGHGQSDRDRSAWSGWIKCVRAVKGAPDLPVRVRYADGQEVFCATVEQARHVIARHAATRTPPRGILPAEISELPATHAASQTCSSEPPPHARAAYELSEHEAFRAVALYLEQYVARTGRQELILLAADTELEADGRTSDQATWGDWTHCVHTIKSHS